MKPVIRLLLATVLLQTLSNTEQAGTARYITRIHSNDVSPWTSKHSQKYQELCRVGRRGPCLKGQYFGPVPEFSLLFPSCDNYGVNCGKQSGSANCISVTGNATLEKLMDETNEEGICIWSNNSRHPCSGYPANYRLYPRDGRCYPVQEFDEVTLALCNGRNYYRSLSPRDNPCKGNKIFQAVDEINGDCDCGRKDEIYWQSTDDCYQSNTQGPCPAGQWIVLDPNGRPQCRTTTCPTDGDHAELRNPITGSAGCYEFSSSGFTSAKQRPKFGNIPDEHPCEFFLFRTSLYPEEYVCSGSVACGIGLLQPPLPDCPAGSKRSLSGKCRRVHS